jgi:hypothetical protein
VGFGVETWSGDGEVLGPEEHLARARELAVVERSTVATVATSSWQLDSILEVAGPVIAWGGLP